MVATLGLSAHVLGTRTSRFLGTKSRWALSNLVKFTKAQQSDFGAIFGEENMFAIFGEETLFAIFGEETQQRHDA